MFVTAHDLRNAAGLTALACDLAAAKKMNVLMMFMGGNATDKVPLFLRANRLDRASCPMVWFDGRYEFSSRENLKERTMEILDEAVKRVNPSVLLYVDDEEDWFKTSLETGFYRKERPISVIQLKRGTLHNLRWIGSLTPRALAGIHSPQNSAESSMEQAAN